MGKGMSRSELPKRKLLLSQGVQHGMTLTLLHHHTACSSLAHGTRLAPADVGPVESLQLHRGQPVCCHITQRLVTWQGTSHLGSAPLALQQAEQRPMGPRLRGTASACQRGPPRGGGGGGGDRPVRPGSGKAAGQGGAMIFHKSGA